MIGEKLSPILLEMEAAILEFDASIGIKPDYSMDAFRATTKIFMSVLMDKIWELQEAEEIETSDRLTMAFQCGAELRNIIKKYTNIDTHSFYNNPK